MDRRIAFLYAAIVAAAEQFAITREECSADGNATFREPEASFVDRDFQHVGIAGAIGFGECRHAYSSAIGMCTDSFAVAKTIVVRVRAIPSLSLSCFASRSSRSAVVRQRTF